MAHHTNKTVGKSERLPVLTDAEQEALYGLPDFDEAQQWEFLLFSANELALARNRSDLSAQVYCMLQIGYFKAKQAFFQFSPDEVGSDCHFVMHRYFCDTVCEPKMITDHEYYTQRKLIAWLFGYRQWIGEFLPQLVVQAEHLVRRDITPGFIATELICWLNDNKIVRPGYSTFQKIISKVLVSERQRLADILSNTLKTETREALDALLVKKDALSELTTLKQDAKSFRWRQMVGEREKRTLIAPLYWVAKSLLPQLGISQQNLLYFASLASFYTIYDLRNLKKEQTWLYLLCYVWLRYRQLSDNLVSALIWHMRQTEERCSAEAKKCFEAAQLRRQQDNQKLGRVLSLFVDDSVPDNLSFGVVRQRAWKIIPRDSLQQAALQMSSKPDSRPSAVLFSALP